MEDEQRSPSSIDPLLWSQVDPLVRSRFHEFGSHISRLEGIITGLSMRVPERPETVPMLAQRVHALEEGRVAIEVKVDKVGEKVDDMREDFNSFALKVVGCTTILTAVVTGVVQSALR